MTNLKVSLPDGFLDSETRCGYEISSSMKKVWAVEIDLLLEVMRVCQKHHIQYFADGGTLLGAVRHKGMIPWDDDIDLGMLRPDYDRFCEVAPQEFQEPYFFQVEETDPGSLRGHIQIRNSQTTGILKDELSPKRKFNQGIFIDIFPFDNVPDDDAEFEEFARILKRKREIYSSLNDIQNVYRPSFFGFFKRPVKYLKHKFLPKEKTREAYDDFIHTVTKYANVETRRVGCMLLDQSRHLLYPRESFARSMEVPFEFFHIVIPVDYEKILTIQYGDWHVPVKGGSFHGGVLFDTTKPYTEYLASKTANK